MIISLNEQEPKTITNNGPNLSSTLAKDQKVKETLEKQRKKKS